MELVKTLLSKIDFNAIVSDTFTLIVGFVVIGIPLALQLAGQDSDRYDNALLTKRLTTGWVITPNSLIILTIIYIISGASLKILSSKESSIIISPEHLTFLTSISIGLFVVTIFSSVWFYFRFYLRIIKTTALYIPDLLRLKSSIFLRAIQEINKYRKIEFLEDLIEKYEFKKYSKRDYDRVSSGIEVLIEQTKNKPWDKSYKLILQKLNLRIKRAYFGRYDHAKPAFTEMDIQFLKLYWDALLRIIRDARQQGNVENSFMSQRYLADVLSNIIHHPQYSQPPQIVTSNYNLEGNEGIIWDTDIYEIARWQSQQGSQGIDLSLECEWFGGIADTLSKPNLSCSYHGTLSAFKCLTGIWEILAKKHPDKILSAYKNISENLPSHHDNNDIPYFQDHKLDWLYSFFEDFYNNKRNLSTAWELQEALDSLKTGDAYVKYGEAGQSRPLTIEEYDEFINGVDIKDVFNGLYLKSTQHYALKLIAILAFFERWNELKDCLEWCQPTGAILNYGEQGFFPSNITRFATVLQEQLISIKNDFWFFGRHNVEMYVFRGSFRSLMFLLKKSGPINSLYSGGTLQDNLIQEKILKGLLKQKSFFLSQPNTDCSDLIQLLNRTIKNLDITKKNRVLNDPIDKQLWLDYKAKLVNGWDNRINKPGRNLNILSLVKFLCVDDILPINEVLIREKFNRSQFLTGANIERNSTIYGEQFYGKFMLNLYILFLEKAKNSKTSKNITHLPRLIVFADNEELTKLGFEPIEKSNSWAHPSHKNWHGEKANNKDALIIDLELVYIKISNTGVGKDYNDDTEFFKKSPIFSYLIKVSQTEVELVAEVYYDVEFESDSVCFFLN